MSVLFTTWWIQAHLFFSKELLTIFLNNIKNTLTTEEAGAVLKPAGGFNKTEGGRDLVIDSLSFLESCEG